MSEHYENYLRYLEEWRKKQQPFTASQQDTPPQYLPYAQYPSTPKQEENNMSVFGKSRMNMGTVVPFVTPEDSARTVYAGQLVWFVPRVTGGKVAARVISIDIESKTVELEITATKRYGYPRGSREFHVPFTSVFKRSTVSKHYWPTPRFSFYWVDYPTAKERAGEEWQRVSKLVSDQ
jgi:hypothetical protein